MKLDYEQIPKKFVNFTRKKLLCKHANFIFKKSQYLCVDKANGERNERDSGVKQI